MTQAWSQTYKRARVLFDQMGTFDRIKKATKKEFETYAVHRKLFDVIDICSRGHFFWLNHIWKPISAFGVGKNRPLLVGTLIGALIGGAGCSTDKETVALPGDRASILLSAPGLRPDPSLDGVSFDLPTPNQLEIWAQPGGAAMHSVGNIAFSESPKIVWRRTLPGFVESFVGSPPVILQDVVFSVSGSGDLYKLDSQNGKVIWSVSIKSEAEEGSGFGGGVSFGNGQLYATAGLNEVYAVDPASGDILWRQPLLAPARGAPSVSNRAVLVSSIDNSVTALDPQSGTLLWRQQKPLEATTVLGASTPVQNGRLAVFASAAGEIFTVDLLTGAEIWQDSLKKRRNFLFSTQLEDIHAAPVILNNKVYAGSLSGRLLAFSLEDGRRLWEASLSTATMPWVTQNTIFATGNSGLLVALDAQTGLTRWVTSLPQADDSEAKNDRYSWTGPILAGGFVWVGSLEGLLLKIDPQSGEVLETRDLGRKIVAPLAVASGRMIVGTYAGTLFALQ